LVENSAAVWSVRPLPVLPQATAQSSLCTVHLSFIVWLSCSAHNRLELLSEQHIAFSLIQFPGTVNDEEFVCFPWEVAMNSWKFGCVQAVTSLNPGQRARAATGLLSLLTQRWYFGRWA
jgi:hypothetical protein